MSIDYEWVDKDHRFAELCEQWLAQPSLIIDTEFMRQTTFYPIVGLIQVADQFGVYLIDPLVCDLSPLASVLTAPDVVKVLHAPSEDLEVFQRVLGCLPAPLFDTQTAAAIAGLESGMSFARLVAQLEGTELPKEATRSDWLQRPLTPQQLEYACADVVYLQCIYPMLLEKLDLLGRLSWVQEDSARLLTKLSTLVPADQYYLRVKGAGRLNRRQLSVVQEITLWREPLVRQMDMARGRVLPDKVVLEIARRLPRTLSELQSIEGVGGGTMRRHGEQLLVLIETALQRPEDQCPSALPLPLTGVEKNRLKSLQQSVITLAEKVGIGADVLARKKDLTEVLRNSEISNPLTQGWRREYMATLVKGGSIAVTEGETQ